MDTQSFHVLFQQGKYTTYKTQTDKLEFVGMWQYNRPPDDKRVLEIFEYENTHRRVDGIILIAQTPNGFFCYDGYHRLKSFSYLAHPLECLVQIMWNSSEEEVIAEFRRINSAVSVPELYVSDTCMEFRGIVSEVVDTICGKWPNNVSTANYPQRPNFNRDKMKNAITDLFKENIHITCDKVMEGLQELNNRYKSDLKFAVSLPKSVRVRAEKTGNYVFCKKHWDKDFRKLLEN